jgi:hypothetical protein
MSSEVKRKGKFLRPAWNHQDDTWDDLQLEMQESIRNVLEDIRGELQQLNRTLGCPNFQAIPARLKRISRNTFVGKNGRAPKHSEK